MREAMRNYFTEVADGLLFGLCQMIFTGEMLNVVNNNPELLIRVIIDRSIYRPNDSEFTRPKKVE